MTEKIHNCNTILGGYPMTHIVKAKKDHVLVTGCTKNEIKAGDILVTHVQFEQANKGYTLITQYLKIDEVETRPHQGMFTPYKNVPIKKKLTRKEKLAGHPATTSVSLNPKKNKLLQKKHLHFTAKCHVDYSNATRKPTVSK